MRFQNEWLIVLHVLVFIYSIDRLHSGFHIVGYVVTSMVVTSKWEDVFTRVHGNQCEWWRAHACECVRACVWACLCDVFAIFGRNN